MRHDGISASNASADENADEETVDSNRQLPCHADMAVEINANVEATIETFEASFPNSDELLDKASGFAVIPEVFKDGFVVGANEETLSWAMSRRAWGTVSKS